MARRSGSNEAGYSLIEIMVALFIVGLTTTFVVLSLPQGADPLQLARTGFQRQLEVARQVSQTSGEAVGVQVSNTASSVVVFRRGEWVPADQFGELQRFDLDWDMTFRVLDPDRRFDNRLKSEKEKEELILKPQIWFDASGVATSEVVELSSPDRRIRFTVDRTGNLMIEEVS